MESDFHSFFGRRFFSFFFDLGSILGGFGRQKSSFGRFFFDVFFERVSASILRRFWEARDLKNSNFPHGKQRILQNRRFRISSEKSSILASFLEAKTEKNR